MTAYINAAALHPQVQLLIASDPADEALPRACRRDAGSFPYRVFELAVRLCHWILGVR